MDYFVDYILPMMVMLNLMVLIHIAGHFIGAKILGITVSEVSLGFGPRLFGVSRNSMLWKITWVPIGGYIKPEISYADDGNHKKKIGVCLFGPLFSIGFFIIVFVALFVMNGMIVVQEGQSVSVPQNLTDSIVASINYIGWTLRVSFMILYEALTGTRGTAVIGSAPYPYLESVASNLIVLLATWSLKFGLLNLLPFPKLDGSNVLGLVIASLSGKDSADKIMKWVFRIAVAVIVLVIGKAAWNDLMYFQILG